MTRETAINLLLAALLLALPLTRRLVRLLVHPA